MTREELEKMADLAKLSLAGEDVDTLLRDMDNVIEFANTILAVEPVEVDLPEENPDAQSLREDVMEASSPIEQILQNASEQWDGYFVALFAGILQYQWDGYFVARKMGGAVDE